MHTHTHTKREKSKREKEGKEKKRQRAGLSCALFETVAPCYACWLVASFSLTYFYVPTPFCFAFILRLAIFASATISPISLAPHYQSDHLKSIAEAEALDDEESRRTAKNELLEAAMELKEEQAATYLSDKLEQMAIAQDHRDHEEEQEAGRRLSVMPVTTVGLKAVKAKMRYHGAAGESIAE